MLLITSNVFGIQLSDLVGSWKGARTQTENGVGTRSKMTLSGRISKGTLTLKEIGFSPQWGRYTGNHRFAKGGKFTSSVIASGIILASASGSWKIDGDQITMAFTNKNFGGTSKFNGGVTVDKNDNFRFSATSKGVKLVISGKP